MFCQYTISLANVQQVGRKFYTEAKLHKKRAILSDDSLHLREI